MSGIYTLPSHQPFLPSLANGLVAQLGNGLADALVLLPSRRACLALRDAFLDHCGDGAMLLPRLEPVADAGHQDLPLLAEDLDIPPAIDPLRRQLLLAEMVHAKVKNITDEHAIRLAADLASFLDEMQTEEIEFSLLHDLVEGELATHWQEILKFLRIVGDLWPGILAQEGRIDPAHRRRLLLERTSRRWQMAPPVHPVIAAGITGTIPAVAKLLKTVNALPMGQIILPGLDVDLDEASWQAVETSPTHPQFGLRRLLSALQAERDDVAIWGKEDTSAVSARGHFLSDIMRPSRTSDIWQNLPPPNDAALQGLERGEMADFAAEAELLALRMRETLENPGRKVALVTSDRTLGRRVAAELKRFGISVDDSAGVPLDQTPPGSFLILSARAIIEGLPPVQLLALLKHPLAQGGMAHRVAFRSHVRALERAVLRGTRRSGGFAALKNAITDEAQGKYWPSSILGEDLHTWLNGIDRASVELQQSANQPSQSFHRLIDAHLAFAEWLASNDQGDARELWAKEAGQAAAAFMARLREGSSGLKNIAVSAYPALLAVLMGHVPVHPQIDRHPRAAILGQLESRLHDADTVLIGGLNEGVWPRPPEASPWLNRAMRKALGLPPAEQQIGIAAHDFVQAASASQVLVSRARKDAGGAPTTASRWLARLDAVLRAKDKAKAVDIAQHWHHWATCRAIPAIVHPTKRPEPLPPLAARPRVFWVTDVETLMRNPYQFYARRILDLQELEPLDAEPGAIERGQIIHAALEDFVRQYPLDLPQDPLAEILQRGERHFAQFAQNPQVRTIWWPRFVSIAEWFVQQEQARRQHVQNVLAERTGESEFAGISGPFTLKARADRIEIGRGQFNIVDYKTGQVPKPAEVVAGLRPQLPLTALIAQNGGFKDVHGASAAELLYWGLKGGAEPGIDSNPLARFDVAEVIGQAGAGIARLVEYFNQPETSYPAVPRPEISGLAGPFDHLARNKEWQGSLAVRGDDR